jgi:CHAT domain-containing protein
MSFKATERVSEWLRWLKLSKPGPDAPGPDELVQRGMRHFAQDFANPAGEGCIPAGVLNALIHSATLPSDDIREHLLTCSVCFVHYRSELARHRAGASAVTISRSFARSQLVPILGASVLAIAIITLFVFKRDAARPGPAQTVANVNLNTNTTNNSVSNDQPPVSTPSQPPQTSRDSRHLIARNNVDVDLEMHNPRRTPEGTTSPSINLRRMLNTLRFKLPPGSPKGKYKVSLANPFGHYLRTVEGISRDGLRLRVDLDLSSVKAGNYLVCVGRQADVPQCVVATVGPARKQMSHAARNLQDAKPCADASRQLAPGERVVRELGGGECHSYALSLPADRFLPIIVEQRRIDVTVTIYTENGIELSKVDRPNGSRGPETISLITPAQGSYQLVIKSLETVSARGEYELTIGSPRPPRPEDDTQIKAEQLISDAEALRTRSPREAIAKFEAAAVAWRSLRNDYEEALALYGAGFTCKSLGDNQEAIDYLQRALPVFVRLNDASGEAMVRAGLGWPYLYLADLDKAFESFQTAFELHRAEKNLRGQGIALYGLGWVHALRGEDQKALQKFSESLECRRNAMDRKGEALTLTGIGKIESRLGHYDDALKHLSLALSTLPKGDAEAQADILSNLGWVNKALNETDKAMGFFKTALTIRCTIGDLIGEATTRYGMSILHRSAKRFAEAESEISEAVKIIESLRIKGSNQQLRLSYFASVQDYYEFYIALLIEMDQLDPRAGHVEKAINVSERARARGLLDLLAEAKIDLRRSTQIQPLTATEVQKQILDRNTMLLQYVLSEPHSFLLAVTADETAAYELPSRREIENVSRRFYEAVTVRNSLESDLATDEAHRSVAQADALVDQVGRELSRMLLSPVSRRVTGQRLVIVAPGVLQFIPFAALPDPASVRMQGPNDTVVKSDSNPLVEDHEVIMLPSVTALSAIRKEALTRAPAAKSVVVLADPVFDGSDARVRQRSSTDKSHAEFARLISSRWEGEKIVSLVRPGEGKLLVDFAANRAFALSGEVGQFRIVHFATHALVDFEHPAQSGIVLSRVDENGKPQDGLVSLDDIFNLKMPADLVVLSGCRTALGKDYAGEGLVGLTRAFMYAGAARVAVSLWQVADKSTAELMIRFHRYMHGPEKLPAAAALRAAQLDLRKDPRWRSPYFWASFTLQGDWR